jgi:glutamine amidotransferase
MKRIKIAILDYDLGNLFSVKNALDSLGIESIISSNHDVIMSCDAAILPGVGAFNVAMKNITKLKLDDIIYRFIETGKPFIGICLGFQLLFSRSFEFLETKGLGIIDGDVLRIPSIFKGCKNLVPNVGWLTIFNKNGSFTNEEFIGFNQNEYMYFVHSYFAKPTDEKLISSSTFYGNFEFCSSVKKDNVFGVLLFFMITSLI